MSDKKYLRYSLGTWFPRWLAKAFYFSVFKILQISLFFLDRKGSELWYRHSYSQPYWMPFASDLDLTFWTNLQPNSEKIQQWIKIYSFIRKVFPIVGEVNFYWENGKYSSWCNTYLLQKDPELKRRIPRNEVAPAEKITYILKTIEVNSLELTNRSIFRSKKWINFNQTIGESVDVEDPLNGYLEIIGKYFDNPLFHLEEIQGFLNGSYQNNVTPTLRTGFFNRYCYRHDIPFFSDPESLQVIYETYRWEVWGIASQLPVAIRNPDKQQEFKKHLSSLIESMPNIENRELVQKELKSLLNYF
jgi:hypothetical protein